MNGITAEELMDCWEVSGCAYDAEILSRLWASVPPEMRAKLGITEGLIRLSCGVEEVDDLLADLERGFADMPSARGTKSREQVAAD